MNISMNERCFVLSKTDGSQKTILGVFRSQIAAYESIRQDIKYVKESTKGTPLDSKMSIRDVPTVDYIRNSFYLYGAFYYRIGRLAMAWYEIEEIPLV